jgi:tetratricopeptide (TPR) repeat protein
VSRGAGIPPLRVEQALRLLPDIDALGPLRAFLLATSQGGDEVERYRTVGKRFLQPGDLRALVPRAAAQVAAHLTSLYQAAVDALEAEQRDDQAGAVRALLSCGELEERVGRGSQARAWYHHALQIAEGLRDRRPEITALRRLGHLEAARDAIEQAARYYQRSLVLAEAEMDHEGAARACLGLGAVALAQAKWQGAESWFRRGLQCGAEDRVLIARLHLGLGDAALGRGQMAAAADRLAKARELFEEGRHVTGTVRTLNAQARLDAVRERRAEALASFREALARLQTVGGEPRLEIAIRLNICQLYFDWNRLPDAEDEIRAAEETAILHNAGRDLARLYLLMGRIRGRQHDDTGFVFFEKAVELCRGPEPAPRLESEVYLEYGIYRRDLRDLEEARAYMERAHEILEDVGDGPLLARIDAELAQLPTEETTSGEIA